MNNSKYSICIIGVYFGNLPQWFNLWLKSCEYNKTVDFLIVTDNHIQNLPSNVRVEMLTLAQFKALAEEKLGMKISLSRPYKCCDFKPVYGVILQDFIVGYHFWGHCDFDLIFGDIRKFITDEILETHDKILTLGHLTFYLNTFDCNQRYKLEANLTYDYKVVFSTDKNFAFDEIEGINKIYSYHGFTKYDNQIFADITNINYRFKLTQKKRNSNYQVFYWERGKILRAYCDMNKSIQTDEFIYIHFQKRKLSEPLFNHRNADSFYITPMGFTTKSIGIPTIEDIKKYNQFKNALYEKWEEILFFTKDIIRAIPNKIKTVLKKNLLLCPKE